jgi:hypothetical protein
MVDFKRLVAITERMMICLENMEAMIKASQEQMIAN